MDVYNKDSCKRIIICKYNVCFNDSLISYGNVCDGGASAAYRGGTHVDTVISMFTTSHC